MRYVLVGGIDEFDFFLSLRPITPTRINCTGAHRRDQQNGDGAAEGPLSLRPRPRRRAVTHRTALAECRSGPQSQTDNQDGYPQLHRTPRYVMRNASAKNVNIRHRHTTSATISTHFMVAISNFRCMK